MDYRTREFDCKFDGDFLMAELLRGPRNKAELTVQLDKCFDRAFTHEKKARILKFTEAWQEFFISSTAEMFASAMDEIRKTKEELEELRSHHSELLRQRKTDGEYLEAIEKRLAARIESAFEDLSERR